MPFVAQNCAAIPGTLFESILFGTKLGSFTGARDAKGLIEAADGGTLFLDEINSMDITLQAKLLRFLQEGQIRRLGDNSTHEVDVRVIAATNENPYDAIASGRLRNDLFYRLNAINFSLPPLRDSKSDIVELSNYYLEHFNKELNKNIQGFSEDAEIFLKNYSWPGNVRELRHIIEHAINITETNYITLNDLPDYINTNSMQNIAKNHDLEQSVEENIYIGSLNEQLEQFERNVILNALKIYHCNVSKTAKRLNIPRQTLYYKIDKLNIKLEKNAE
jgi:arginine utilization regulatory protein